MKRTLTLAMISVISVAAIGTFAIANGGGMSHVTNMHGGINHDSHHNGMMDGNDHDSHHNGMMNGNDHDSHHNGMMGGMGSDYQHMGTMFDVNALSKSLALNNEQISILSQLEASHIMVMAAMQTNHEDNSDNFGHHQMMLFMLENHELMSEHMALYQQFTDSLSDEQQSTWKADAANCMQ